MGPCLNPHCKSHGKPHPNCKCYSAAHGADVSPFCSEAREHKQGCEYYMDEGGWVDTPEEPTAVQSHGDWVDAPAQNTSESDWQDADQDKPAESQAAGKYDTTEQQVKAGLEGAAQGIAGPLAVLAETKLFGVDPKDIRGRAEANPIIHGASEAATLAGGLLTGFGEAGLIAKGAGLVSEASQLGRAGAAILKGAIEGASFATSDEITKAMLGQPGSDPATPVSAALLHVGAAGLMGGIAGGVFNLGEKLIGSAVTDSKMAEKLEAFLIKLGESKNPLGDLGIPEKISKGIAGYIATEHGSGPLTYELIKNAISKPIEKITGKFNPLVTDAAIKLILSNEASGMSSAAHYAMQVANGAKKALRGVADLFKAGSSQIAPKASDAAHEELKKFIEGGQVDQQLRNTVGEAPSPYAAGGMVSSPNNAFSNVFPEQNTLLNQTKGRVSMYLNSIRPLPNQSKLPFDEPNPQTQKKRSYDKAIALAVNPLSILNHINDGSVTPEHVKHFTSLYPEVHSYLSKEMSKQILKAQMSGQKLPYKKRQAMSLFLGASLDSTFTPPAIQTIQGVFAMKRAAQQQAPQKNKKGTLSLTKMDDHYLTGNQARTERQQAQKA